MANDNQKKELEEDEDDDWYTYDIHLINMITESHFKEAYKQQIPFDSWKYPVLQPSLQQLKNNAELINEVAIVPQIKIHRILYILYCLFYKEFHRPLFPCNFEAWKCGIVEKDYWDGCHGNYQLLDKFYIRLKKDEESRFVRSTIALYLNIDAKALLMQTLGTEPWKENYGSKNGKWNKIPTKAIHEYVNMTSRKEMM